MTQKLYRPYLSLSEISHLLSLLAPDLSTQEAKTSYGKLFKLKLEAEMGLRKESHILAPSIEQKLGLASQEEPTKNPAELWSSYCQNPQSLSLAQIKIAKTYAWESGLMSDVEARIFEAENNL